MPTTIESTALTTLAMVKAIGKIPSPEGDARLEDLIGQVSAAMQQYCGRHFRSQTYTHNAAVLPRLSVEETTTRLFLPEYPVTAVSSLKVYPTWSALTEGYDGGFVIEKREGIIQLVNGAQFMAGYGLIEIVYTAGYQDTPTAGTESWFGWNQAAGDLQMACARQVLWEFRANEREKDGVASQTIGDSTTSYLTDAWLPRVKEVLDRYRRIR